MPLKNKKCYYHVELVLFADQRRDSEGRDATGGQ